MNPKASIWSTTVALGTLLSATSFAADLPVKAVAVPPSVYNWTGVYVGGHVGYGMGMKDWINSSFDYQVDGFLGGGQIGVNQQVGNLVFGIEGDASWSNIKGNQTLTLGGPLIGFAQTASAGTKIDGLATLTGRLGLAQDRWLVYVKGGAAWAHEKHDFNASLTTIGGPPVTQTVNRTAAKIASATCSASGASSPSGATGRSNPSTTTSISAPGKCG